MKDLKKLLKKEIHQVFDGSAEEKEELKQKIGVTNVRKKKNKYPIIISLSTAFACVLLMLILIPKLLVNPGNDNNVPTYIGMSVEKMPEKKALMSNTLEDNHEDLLEEIFEYDDANEYQYYASKGEVVSLNVHLRNPKAYEILSVTINDVKFQSLTFDPEFPSEKILIPYKCSNESGIETITISEIKYIDGTEIKNGKFEAERSIEIGVEYTELPTLNSKVINAGFTTIDFKIDVLDSKNLLKEKMLRLVVIKDNKIIDNKDLVPGDNEIVISNLSMSTEYYYYVLAAFDCLDGNGYKTITLDSGLITTKSGVALINETIDEKSISFNLDYNEDVIIKSIILKNNNLEKNIDVKDNKEYIISDLFSNNDYSLLITYEYQGKEDVVNYEFKTNMVDFKFIDEKQLSAIIILNMVEIVVDNYIDSTYIRSVKFRIYDGDSILAEETNYQFNNDSITTTILVDIEDNKQYTLELYIEYNLNDGSGVKNYSVKKNIMKSN